MKPERRDFTAREWRIIESHRTPSKVQRFLSQISYNRENDGETCLSFRGVVRERRAHCLEAAITAAVILEQYGDPPLLVSLESQDMLDHVLYVFQRHGRWGAIGRSRDVGLHGRKPVFRRIRDLVWSYFDPYIDWTGRITGYAVADLRDLGRYDWRLSERNVWKVERYLQEIPHNRINSSEARYQKWRRRYLEFREQNPESGPDYFPTRHHWLV